MAEFVVFNKMNWMDMPSRVRPDLTGYENVKRKIEEAAGPGIEAQTVKLFELSKMDQKYTRRYQPGDIIEARRDNGPRGKKEKEALLFIQVPEVLLEDGKQYAKAHESPRRYYSIDMTGLKMDDTLTAAQFNSRLKVKE